jgi:putative holliday junction resolvase
MLVPARWMGIDYGDRRIGLAMGDAMGVLATPLRTLQVNGDRDAVRQIAAVVRERGVTGVVVGWPLNMNNTEGERAKKTAVFITKLQAELPALAIRKWDERLTSASVERLMLQDGARRERRKEMVDQLAAQQILQGFLDSLAPPPPPLA